MKKRNYLVQFIPDSIQKVIINWYWQKLCFDSDSDLFAVQRVNMQTCIFLYNIKLFTLNRAFCNLPVLLCWNMKLSTDHSYFDFLCHSRYSFFMSYTIHCYQKIWDSLNLANEFLSFRNLFAKFVQKNKITLFRNKIDFPEKEI